ncbi:vWA domain-containing protein [Caldibacillus thermoamylovorans]|uniref:D-amino acid dehydrogenase large subunit n=2 Tax=Caldibacillus thermoamylovorans TaxID=35841 RepID=A0ABD4A496_9BACI|nr:VWA domain-containing protein [Caldibacillus thermoamylovorans]KIO62366.1 D-amino acid dehydrogenase large subunit [Caldibacillus thermoamylovorans]KIO71873.1 D-amino acid dehydrogenase large subunit [Caldibacillus thermoamylovorans]
MKIFKSILVSALLLFLLSACSNDSAKESNETEDKSTPGNEQTVKKERKEKAVNGNIKVEPLPTTYQELAELPIGKYYNMDTSGENSKEEILKVFSDLPDISGNPSEKELDYFYSELLKRMQQDYEGPENLINRLKFEALGSPENTDSRYQFKDNLNVVFIIDASGSMAQKINGKEKMASAKDSILNFVNKLPKDAKVGIRVYGHKGTGSDADKALSCSSSELVYPISNYNEGEFQAALNKFSPSGWTPIGLAMREAKNDLSSFDGANNTNIVYLVSDGIDTCDDQPIEAAKELYSSNISPIINVIGFDVDSKGQNQLREIASATEGIYDTVTNEGELQEELEKLSNMTEQWKEWLEQGKQKIESNKIANSLEIFSYITDEGSKGTKEKIKIGTILFELHKDGRMNDKSYKYLMTKNTEYHKWIQEQIDQFEKELKALNETSYSQAIKALEDKYITNTQ